MDGEILTVPQLQAMVDENAATLEGAATAWLDAQRAYEINTDRARFSTDEGHAGSVAEHTPALDAAERRAEQAAEVAEINARRVLRQLDDLSAPRLTDAEMAAAGARSPVLEIEADRLPFADLLPKVRAAVATGDRPSMFLWLTLLGQRARAAAEGEVPEETEARQQTRRVLAQIADALRPTEYDELRTRAADTLQKAVETRTKAGTRKTRAALETDYQARGFVRIPDAA